MRRLFLIGCAALALLGVANAQVNVVPQTGLTTGYAFKQSYSAAFIGLVPAASATDLVCISGSSTKTIRLAQIRISGSAGTAVALPLTVLRRVALDSGGTAATTTANPANTISSRNPTRAANSSATATLISYTANPTINDSSPTYLDSQEVNLPTTAAGSASPPALFDWGIYNGDNIEPPTIVNGQTAQQICLNLNSVSVSSGLINGTINWTEE